MKGLILSGGKGTRLYPLTYTRAKQLIPVANKPVLFRVIESIQEAGVTEIGIVVGQTAPEIIEAVGDGSRWGVKITYIHQDSPDGLAHAVKISQDFIGDESFVMFLGDNVLQWGIGSLIQEFESNPWNSQIVLKEVENPSSYGVAKLRDDNSIEQLIEKPPNPPSNLALVGVYMFDKNIFEAVNSIPPSGRGEYEITDAIQWLIDNDYSVFPHVYQGWWIDTGKSKEMLDANSRVLDELKPTIAESASIDSESTVDSRVTLEDGATIINSVVHGPTIIGENAHIEDSYIGPYTSIHNNVTVRESEIVNSIILEESVVTDLDVMLRDSLIGRKATVKSNRKRPRGLKMNLADNSNLWI